MRDIPFIPPTYTRAQEAMPLRTYRDDAVTDVAEQHLSAPQIAAAELNRRSGMRAPIIITRPPSRAVPILIALGLVLMIGGAATYLYQVTTTPSNTPTVTPKGPGRSRSSSRWRKTITPARAWPSFGLTSDLWSPTSGAKP
ncbi:MAG: hypothetical protein HC774_07710, partial [Sphingomonadales bacterium]|nr:hypothetical protein [Sphingomonadales bacterium]